jgi:hypothetical protein
MNMVENKKVLDIRKDSRGKYGLLFSSDNKDGKKWINVK